MPSISDLVRSSSLVFSGVTVAVGASNVSVLPASADLVTVRVTRGLLVNPALGDLRGRVVTVKTKTPHALSPGKSAIFFTRSWIHAEAIAVQEVARMDSAAEGETAAVVQALPEEHLRERFASADLVVLASVTAIRPVASQKVGRHAPNWAAAELEVETAIKGAAQTTTILFPTANSVEWYRAPRFTEGQRGIFIIHRNETRAAAWMDESAAGPDAMTALDPADIQPASEQDRIKRLLPSH